MIIVIANQKGGVGKTTTCVTVATGMAELGYPTVLVDADSQGNAAQFLGLDPRPEEHADTIAKWQARFPGLVLPAVRRLIAYGKAPGAGEPIWDYAPNAAEDYADVMAAILPRLSRQLQRQAVRP